MTDFLQTPLSRAGLPGRINKWSFHVPEFDGDRLVRDLALLHAYNDSLEYLLKNLYDLFRVYFYQPDVFSFLPLGIKPEAEVINIETSDIDTRTKDDWGGHNADGILNYVKKLPKGSVLITPDVRFRTYFRADPDLSDILMLPTVDEQFSLLEQKMVTTRDIPYITDFRLIEKNKPKGLGNDCAACSSFLMPVWYQEQLLGVLFYGTAVFGLFSSLNNILNINDILYLQLVEPFFALHLSRHLGGSLTKKPSLIR